MVLLPTDLSSFSYCYQSEHGCNKQKKELYYLQDKTKIKRFKIERKKNRCKQFSLLRICQDNITSSDNTRANQTTNSKLNFIE